MESKRKIRVLHCITSLLPDGAQQMLLKLCACCNREHFEHRVIALGEARTLEENFHSLGIPVRVLGMKRSVPELGALRRLTAEITETPPDVLQGWLYHANLAVSLAACFSNWQGRVFWNIRRSLYSTEQDRLVTRAVIRLSSLLSRAPDKIIYNGAFMAEQHAHYGFCSRNSLVIPNGFDTDVFRPISDAAARLRKMLGISPETLIVGTVGRFHPHKDQRTFIQAAASLAAKDPDIHFVLIGRGIEQGNSELWRWVCEGRLERRVSLLGERRDIVNLLPGFDIFCSPSLSEGFPNAIGEAMSCALPCVVTDAGASAEIIGDAGIVVPRQDGESLARGISKLLEFPEQQRLQLGTQARERIKELFPIDQVVKKYEVAYEKAVLPNSESNLRA